MNVLSRNKVLATGIALILLTNVIVIGGALYNRSGEPDAVVTLSERELTLYDWNRKENSGLSLLLNWHGYAYDTYDTRRWLNHEKMVELGFDLPDKKDRAALRQYARKQLPRPVWVVLEFDGATYREVLQDAEKKFLEEQQLYSHEPDSATQKARLQDAAQNLQWVRVSDSRLYVIDAGRDPEQLRQRYPDRAHFIVAAGVVRLDYDYYGGGREEISGYIPEVSVTHIHVAHEQRAVFDALPDRHYIDDGSGYARSFNPRFRVRLAWGRRYEPWIVNVEKFSN